MSRGKGKAKSRKPVENPDDLVRIATHLRRWQVEDLDSIARDQRLSGANRESTRAGLIREAIEAFLSAGRKLPRRDA